MITSLFKFATETLAGEPAKPPKVKENEVLGQTNMHLKEPERAIISNDLAVSDEGQEFASNLGMNNYNNTGKPGNRAGFIDTSKYSSVFDQTFQPAKIAPLATNLLLGGATAAGLYGAKKMVDKRKSEAQGTVISGIPRDLIAALMAGAGGYAVNNFLHNYEEMGDRARIALPLAKRSALEGLLLKTAAPSKKALGGALALALGIPLASDALLSSYIKKRGDVIDKNILASSALGGLSVGFAIPQIQRGIRGWRDLKRYNDYLAQRRGR